MVPLTVPELNYELDTKIFVPIKIEREQRGREGGAEINGEMHGCRARARARAYTNFGYQRNWGNAGKSFPPRGDPRLRGSLAPRNKRSNGDAWRCFQLRVHAWIPPSHHRSCATSVLSVEDTRQVGSFCPGDTGWRGCCARIRRVECRSCERSRAAPAGRY